MPTTYKFKGVLFSQAIGEALGLGTEEMTTENMAWKCHNGILASKVMNTMQA